MRTSLDVRSSDLDIRALCGERFPEGSVMICPVVSEVEEHTLEANAHFQAGPEGLPALMVPGIHDTAAHMLSFRCGLVGVRRFLDVDSELLFRSAGRSVFC